MTLKKNLLLGVLALSALAQTPVSAPNLKKPLGVKLKVARGKAQDWFFSNRSKVVYSDKKESDFDAKFYTEDGDPCNANGHLHKDLDADESVVDVKSAKLYRETNGSYGNKIFSKDICAIPLMRQSGLKSPNDLAVLAVLSALVARIIEGEASITDYAKTAGYSLAGALAASALDSGTTWAKNKALSANKTKTASAAFQVGRAFQFLAFFAGQNPQVAKAIIASIKNGTAGKDLSDFILSLGKDGNQRARIAMFIRNFGSFIFY